MLGGGRKSRAAKISTLISRHAEIDGDIRFAGGMHVEGRIRGNVTAEDDDAVLILSETGVIEGDVRVPCLVLHGIVQGDVLTSRHLELSAGAKVTGSVCYNLLQMAVGAQINGQLLHRKEIPFTDPENGAPSPIAEGTPILDHGSR